MKPKALLSLAALALAANLTGQTAQTVTLHAPLGSTVAGNSGNADVLLHLVKDSSGNIVSASVDFYLAYQLFADTTITGLGITDINGKLVLGTGVTASSPINAAAGSGLIVRQAQVPPGDQAGLAVLNGLLAASSTYHVAAITAAQPVGVVFGQLVPARTAVLMAVVSSSAGSGVATVTITYTGASSNLQSAEVAFQLTYKFPSQVTFSGMRVYSGQGENGQIAVAADVLPGTLSDATGAGTYTVPATEIDMNDTRAVQAVQSMLLNPASYSVDINAVQNASAPLTGQLRATDSMTFQIPGFAGSGSASEVVVHTLRQQSGAVLAGTAIFDVNYRLTAGTTIRSIDIDGAIVATAVTTDPSGSGNVYTMAAVSSGAGLTSLNGLVVTPSAHKIDVVTNTTMTAPLAVASNAVPVINAVIPIVEVTNLTTFAPGELVEVYGTNLSQVTTDLSGWPGVSLPSSLNGVSAILGGHGTRVLYVSPGQVDLILPFGAALGSQPLTLTTANGTSAAFPLNIAQTAPALYNFAFENSNFSLVSSSNPASVGDTLVFYMTGMGQTNPILLTGQIVPNGPPFYNTVPVTVTIAGTKANVIYSIAAPPYVAGLYQMAVTIPDGVPAGSQPVIATAGGLQSNTVMISMK